MGILVIEALAPSKRPLLGRERPHRVSCAGVATLNGVPGVSNVDFLDFRHRGAGEKYVSELSPARRDFRLYERERSTNDENANRYHLASAGAGPSHLRPNDGNRPQESGFWKDLGNNQQGQRRSEERRV